MLVIGAVLDQAALAKALGDAAGAGQFGVVAQLAKKLEARRLARAGNVLSLEAVRRAKGRSVE